MKRSGEPRKRWEVFVNPEIIAKIRALATVLKISQGHVLGKAIDSLYAEVINDPSTQS